MSGLLRIGLFAMPHRLPLRAPALRPVPYLPRRLPPAVLSASRSAASGAGEAELSMDINGAVDKAWEHKSFTEIASAPPSALQGLAERVDPLLAELKIRTVSELGAWDYFIWARAIVVLSKKELGQRREANDVMNINKALDREHETKTLKQILELPPSALQGLTAKGDDLLQDIDGITTIEKLGTWKYAEWANAILVSSKLENLDKSSR